MKYLIGLDIGTSSVKGVLMTVDGRVTHTSHCAFLYQKLENGGVEIDAKDFVSVCFEAIRELSSSANGEILGVCASSASGNLVIIDKENNPATPIYNWQDARVSTEAEEILKNINPDTLYRQTGWPFDYKTFPLALACYIKKHEPHKITNCKMVCMSTEYLYYRLTGKWGISTSAGTPSYFINQVTGEYIPEVLNALEITKEQVPPVMACTSVLGKVTQKASVECGLKAGTPIVLGSFDHPSAARGAGVFDEGEILLSCGTSWVGFFPVKDRNAATDAKVLIDPFLSGNGGCWAMMVSVPSVSERIRIYTNRYIDNSENAFLVLSRLAKKSSSGAGGLVLNMYDEPDDSKVKDFTKEQIARAIMEGVVNLLKEQLDRIKSSGIELKTAVMVGGPSSEPLWHELIKEICGIEVSVRHGASAGAVGAAILAGIGTGIYKDEKSAFKEVTDDRL